MATTPADTTRLPYDIAAWILTGVALVLVLRLHLLPALLAGLLVYEVVHLLAPRLRVVRLRQEQGKLAAVAILATLVAVVLTIAIVAIVTFFRSEAGNLPTLMQRMADVIEGWRAKLPPSVVESLPDDFGQMKETIVAWLRQHASVIQHIGAEAGRIGVHILVGLGIGGLVALHEVQPHQASGPLALALQERAARLGTAFRRIVFAQVRIAALNTVFTALYLAVALPIAGVPVPFTKTMIAVTFFAGLLPVIGNLISNSVIVVVSLSVSLSVAVASLLFLIVVHKLEYFLNARIVGAHVGAHAWELLLVILVMEAAFGIAGVIAAPIYYAYIKDELLSRQLI